MAQVILMLLSTAGSLVIGLLVFLKNSRHATNILFALLSATIALWSLTNFVSVNIGGNEALPWIRAVIFWGALLNALLFLTFHTFPDSIIRVSRPWLAVICVGTVVVAGLAATSFVFRDVVVLGGRVQPVPGKALPLFLIHTLGLIGAAFFVLIKRFREATGRLRTQLAFLLFGAVTSFFLIIMTNFLFVVLFNDTTYIVLGSYYSLIFTLSAAYAILRQGLLDVRMVLARIIAYGALVLLVAAGYAAGLFLVYRFLSVAVQSVAAVALAVLAMIVFDPIRGGLTRLADKLLYSGQYDPDALARRIGQIAGVTIVLERLGRGLLRELITGLRLEYAHLVVFKSGKPYYQAADRHPSVKRVERLPRETIVRLQKAGTVYFDDLSESRMRSWLRSQGVAAAFPFRVENELVALLVLGNKMTGTSYAARDARFLERIAPPIALAVQNAKAYEEISRFAETLKKEVTRATADLRTANARLGELNEMKSNFVSIASHQLRTPIGGVRGYLSMIRDGDYGPISKKQHELMELNMMALDHTLRVIEMFLDVTKMEAGKIELGCKPSNLLAVVADVQHELSDSARRKGLRFRTMLPKTLPTLSLDAEKMRNVIFNLVENAIKYTETGSVTLSVRKTKDVIECTVTDTGIGIAPDEVPKLFAKFVRAGGGFKVSHGSGLGLYIIKTLVEAHGGTVFVQSPGEGKGSTFGFRLPIKA